MATVWRQRHRDKRETETKTKTETETETETGRAGGPPSSAEAVGGARVQKEVGGV